MATTTTTFTDRCDAGRRLADRVRQLPHVWHDVPVVLGLPRGGVPVAAEVARALDAPLDVLVVGKLGLPRQPELAMGAVGEDGVVVVEQRVVRAAGVDREKFARVERRVRAELAERVRRWRGDRPRLDLAGRTVIVVDDGIATGSTARAACRVARARGARVVVLAAPVCSPEAADALRGEVDELVCLVVPGWFGSVGQVYADFTPVPDEEVVAVLRSGSAGPAAPRPA